MKKQVGLMLFLISILLLFTSCGRQNVNTLAVPEYYLEAKTDEYLSWHNSHKADFHNNTLAMINNVISHTPDNESHTDTVDYEVGIQGKYGTFIYECIDVFQYYKDSDT